MEPMYMYSLFDNFLSIKSQPTFCFNFFHSITAFPLLLELAALTKENLPISHFRIRPPSIGCHPQNNGNITTSQHKRLPQKKQSYSIFVNSM
jgi:hypothetical protein